tara:strand:- start:415 stop:759 length:345 start_codon:yes stop_codon:yes gene_type:complete
LDANRLQYSLDWCAALASRFNVSASCVNKLGWLWRWCHIRRIVFSLNATLFNFAPALVWTILTDNHALFAFFFFFAVLAAALKAPAFGAPFAPGLRIVSPDPALMRARFFAMFA